MNLSICESHVQYPTQSTKFIIEQQTQCGWQIIAITETKEEANRIYDLFENKEIMQ